VRQVTREEFAAVAPGVFDRARRRRGGQVDREAPWWERALGPDDWQVTHDLPHNYLLHEGDEGPDGTLAWSARHVPGDWHAPQATVRVQALCGASDEAKRDLWCYLSGLDLVDRIELSGPVDEPVNWLLADARALRATEIAYHLWLKLLDVPAALTARRYPTPDEIVLEVVDDSPVSIADRYRLRAEGGHAAAEPTPARISHSPRRCWPPPTSAARACADS
jgi:predicted acetyltransferase